MPGDHPLPVDISSRRFLVVLNNDLFTGVRIKEIGERLEYGVTIVKNTATFMALLNDATSAVALGIIDLSFTVDWNEVTSSARSGTAPFIAYGPHKDADQLRAANAAGACRVMANSEFHRNAAAMIERYARKMNPGASQ